jgi:hypothetical protein
MSTYKFKYPVCLTWFHSIVTALGMVAMAAAGMFKVKHLPLAKSAPVAAAYAGFVVFNNLSIQYNTVGFYQIAKILITPVVVLVEYVAYGKTVSRQKLAAIALLMLGITIATVSDSQVRALRAAARGACVWRALRGACVVRVWRASACSKQGSLQAPTSRQHVKTGGQTHAMCCALVCSTGVQQPAGPRRCCAGGAEQCAVPGVGRQQAEGAGRQRAAAAAPGERARARRLHARARLLLAVAACATRP